MDFKKMPKKINLDFDSYNTKPVIVKQFDNNSRYIEFTLYNGGELFPIEDEMSFSIYAKKPDGKEVWNKCYVTNKEKSKIIVNISNSIITKEGLVEAELVVRLDDSVYTSRNFTIQVLKCVHSDNSIQSSSEYNELTGMIKELDDAKKGFVKKVGDTMTGALNFSDEVNNLVTKDSNIILHSNADGRTIIASNGNNVVLRPQGLAEYESETLIKTNGDLVASGEIYAGVNNKVYHTGNKPTPTEIGALPTTGGNVTGHIFVDQGKGIFFGSDKTGANKWNIKHDGTDLLFHNGNSNAFRIKDDLTLRYGGNKVYMDKDGERPTADEVGALPTTGGTILGAVKALQGVNVHTADGGSGTEGYMHIAQFKITTNYQNQPIKLRITQRSRSGEIDICFAGGTTSDPALTYINRTGTTIGYIHKSATSTWDLYIQKSESYDSIDVVGFEKGMYQKGITVTWKSATVTSLPSGTVTATLKEANSNALLTTGGTMTGELTMGTNAIKGTNGAFMLKDYGNGNVALSGSKTSSGTAGELYLGYNGTNSTTSKIRLCTSLYNSDGAGAIVSNTGDFNLVNDGNAFKSGGTAIFKGSDSGHVYVSSKKGAGNIYLQPNGMGVTTNQVRIENTGMVTMNQLRVGHETVPIGDNTFAWGRFCRGTGDNAGSIKYQFSSASTGNGKESFEVISKGWTPILKVSDNGEVAVPNKLVSDNIQKYDGSKYIYSQGSNISELSVGNSEGGYMHVSTVGFGAKGVDWWGSDLKMKENVQPLSTACVPASIESKEADEKPIGLDLVNQIEHYSYYHKEEQKDVRVGYVANQLEEIDEAMVLRVEQSEDSPYYTEEDHYVRQPRVSHILPNVTLAIQQLNARLEVLEAENRELKQEIKELKK